MKISKSIKYMKVAVKAIWEVDKSVLITSIVIAIIDGILPYVGILLSAYIIDGLTSGMEMGKLILISAVTVGGIFALTAIKAYIESILGVHRDICVRKFEMKKNVRTLVMDYQLLDSPRVNDIRDRMANDRNWGNGFYSIIYQFPWLVSTLVSTITSIIIIVPLFVSHNLFTDAFALCTIIAFIALITLNCINMTKCTRYEQRSLAESYSSSKFMSYFIWGGFDIKCGKDTRIFNGKGLIQHYIDVDEELFARKGIYDLTKNNSKLGLVNGLASGLCQGGAYIFVVIKAVSGALSVGLVLKYAATIFNLLNSISQLISAFIELSISSERMQSSFEYLNVPDELYKGSLTVEKRADNDYELEFHKVSFKYPGSEDYVLKNLNLKLNIGQKMAVVGLNGSGKTTMIKLLCRLYDPTDGEITLNGIDIKKYDYDEYMGIFSVVFQDFELFSFPLSQNISTGIDIDEDRAVDCLIKAGFSERLSTMPDGLSTFLYHGFSEDGVEISGGEAQKIALARALYKDAPFIILDEPTAALDPIAEFEIYSKFNEIVGEKTAIYISHRLSSCRFCDDIAVFHHGEIIERGNHDALMAKQGSRYSELWSAQAQYYSTVNEQ